MNEFSQEQAYAFEDLERYQKPPELIKTPEEMERMQKKKRKIKKVLSWVTVLLLAVMVLIVAWKLKPVNSSTVVEPTPLPTQGPSQMEEDLRELKGWVDEADPAKDAFGLPPVDMEVEF